MTDQQIDRLIRGLTFVVFAALAVISVGLIVHSLVIEDYGLTMGGFVTAVIGFLGALGSVRCHSYF